MSARTTIAMALAAGLAAGGCKGDKDRPEWDQAEGRRGHASASAGSGAAAAPEPEMDGEDESGGTGTAMALEEGKMGKKDSDRAEGQYKMKANEDAPMAPPAATAPAPGGGKGGRAAGNTPEGPTRAWFPETFLFEPLVVTDAAGQATVNVRVPDRLTTWRVLALAHSRSGSQGGAVTSFLGTLATYVDVVVPEQLVRGDQVRLPLMIVNTSDAAVTTSLSVAADNATVSGGGGTRTVPAQGNAVDYVRLDATRPGKVQLRVALAGGDAVLRTLEVVPNGRPVTVTKSGTLAAPRSFTLEGPAGSDPSSDRVRLQAYPGALALLRSELGVCTARHGAADDAYALLLAGKSSAMLAALGDQPDPEALRDLAILTAQRAVRHGRNMDVDTATLFTEAALAHAQSPVLQRLGARAAAFLVTNQRPDGSFGGGHGESLQQILVTTAEATRAVAAAAAAGVEPQRASGVAIRAAGAFERQLEHVEDGYTAAALLASGALHGATVDTLRAKVKGAIKASDDGARYLDVPAGVVRADGLTPSRMEATALAVLALAGDPQAPMADLGATLLGGYDPVSGWGDGRSNLVCMQAVLTLFKDPVPADVTISLTMDGKPVATGVLARDKLREVLSLDVPAPGLAGPHTWAITATPAVPGLGYALALRAWVPWEAPVPGSGVELSLPGAVSGAVGKPVAVTLRAIAPSGLDLHIRHALPAGVQVDTPSLEALVTAGTITSFETPAGAVVLEVPALEPGSTFAATYRVIPTLGGTLHSGASTIEAGSALVLIPPSTWTIK